MNFKSNSKNNMLIGNTDISHANSTTSGLKKRINNSKLLNRDLVSNGPQFYNIALQKFSKEDYMTQQLKPK